MTRREELDDIFKEVDPNEKKLVNRLIDEVVFLETQMISLKKLPFISINPKNSAQQKITPAAKLYKEHSQSYMNAIRILCSILHKIDSSAENELLQKLSEFS